VKCEAAFKSGAATRLPKGPSRFVLAFVPMSRHFVDDDMGVEFAAYGYEDVKMKPPIPSPAAIQRMAEVLVWLQLAPVEYRRLPWFRGEG